PASGGAPRSPACWPAAPSCGCSTSPTPASTTTPATCSTTWSAGRWRRGRPSSCPPTSSTGPWRWPTAPSSWRPARPWAPPRRRRRPPTGRPRWRRWAMWRDATLVAGRDLRVELRSRVTANQVAPFALLVLVLFAFALDPDGPVLERATPGLYWITVLFAAVLAIARSAAIDEADGVRDALRLSAL